MESERGESNLTVEYGQHVLSQVVRTALVP